MSDQKRCCTCKVSKPLTEFYRNKSKADGYQNMCKPCFREANERSKAKHREARLAQAREYSLAYHHQHKEAARERQQTWYAEHGKEYYRRRRAEKRDEMLAYRRAWIKANPERNRATVNARRAMRLGLVHTHTSEEFAALCARHGGRCAACGGDEPLTRDHIIPLTRGGHDGIDNIQPLCQPCNSRKGTRTIDYRLTAAL